MPLFEDNKTVNFIEKKLSVKLAIWYYYSTLKSMSVVSPEIVSYMSICTLKFTWWHYLLNILSSN